MQTTGYIEDRSTGKKVLILVRQSKYWRVLKHRKTGKNGNHFTDEEDYLNIERDKLERLKAGETVKC